MRRAFLLIVAVFTTSICVAADVPFIVTAYEYADSTGPVQYPAGYPAYAGTVRKKSKPVMLSDDTVVETIKQVKKI